MNQEITQTRAEEEIQGIGQGNGAGWAVVSSPILEMLRIAGFVCSFKIAISGEEISFVGYAFVDDTDQVTAGKDNKTYKEVVKGMQAAADEFEGGVRAAGI